MKDVNFGKEDDMNLGQGDAVKDNMNQEDNDKDNEAEVFSIEPISDNDSYESVEDEAYKPPPLGFEDDTDDSYDSYEDKGLMKKIKSKDGKRDKKGKKKTVEKKDNIRKKARLKHFGDVQLQLNMECATFDQFKHALKDYTIAEGGRIFMSKVIREKLDSSVQVKKKRL
ncbi:hypothetical protein S83_015133 [Arachis hypogaea]